MNLNTKITEWIGQVEQLIIMGDWNIEASEMDTCMKTQGITNAICNLHG